MRIKCKRIVGGYARGKILLSDQPINFLGMLDTKTGIVSDSKHTLNEKTIKDKILVFPNSIGSSVGAYTIFSLKKNNASPKGIICTNTVDITTASGSAISKIPLVFMNNKSEAELLLSYIKNSGNNSTDEVTIDAKNEVIIINANKSI